MGTYRVIQLQRDDQTKSESHLKLVIGPLTFNSDHFISTEISTRVKNLQGDAEDAFYFFLCAVIVSEKRNCVLGMTSSTHRPSSLQLTFTSCK